MTVNSNNPFPGTVNAVRGRLSSVSATCQYPLLRSIVEMYPFNLSRVALTWGKGYASFSDTLFKRLKSIQKRYLPFFFLVITIGALHGLLEG